MVGSAAMAMEGTDEASDTEPAPQTRTVSVTPTDRVELTSDATELPDALEEALAARAELEAAEPAPDPVVEPEPEPEAEAEPEASEPEAVTSGQGVAVWDSLAQCESGQNWSIDTGNGYYGGLQFDHRSWHWAGGDRYSEYPHTATKAQQIEIAERLLDIHPAGWGAWPACSAQLGLN
jgi:hypothetical protein